MNGKVTYRQQFTRCGKQRCRKCKEGSGHGPYWYAYWSSNGRTVSKYIGTVLPEQLKKEQDSNVPPPSSAAPSSQTAVPTLRVYLLGQFRIERKQENNAWQTIDGRLWHRRRARSLLGCLLSSPNRRLGREQVMNLLWPDLEIDIAANRLNGAVHELRQMLEPGLARPASSQLLRLERDILELANVNSIWVDTEAFEHLIKEADTAIDPAQSRQLQEKAAALYRGSYLLEELYSEWAAQRRDALHRAWVGLLLNLAQSQANNEEYASAIDTLDRLRTADPTNETAVQHLMMLLTQRDRRGEALQVYRQHESMLQRDYEGEPLPETSELYEKLRKGHIPTLYSQQQSDNPVKTPQLPVEEPRQKTEPFFTRPAFQRGRHNQSPLIGRERELKTLYQVICSLEELTTLSETLSPRQKQTDGTLNQHQSFKTASISRSRYPHFILLRGEPGIGKTRLAEELSLESYKRGWTVAWSRSYEQESSIPYHPWTDLLRTLFKSIATFAQNHTQQSSTADDTNTFEFTTSSLKLDRLRALLPDIDIINPATTKAAPAISLEQERLHLWEAALGLISTFSKQQPLLLVLDDLHWADDSSIDLLTYLIHHIQDQCILLVGTCREGELSPQHKLRSLIADLQREQAIVTVPILPLTHTQIGTLVSYLPQNIIQSIQSQAAGNPFFAEELARYVDMPSNEEIDTFSSTEQKSSANALYSSATYTHQQQVDSTTLNQADLGHTRSSISLPEAIAAVLERRLDRLSQGCQQLLSKAAVIGGSFELRQLLPIASEYDEDNILDLLEEALNAGLLIEEGTGANILYHFWHPLIINHLYRRLSAARRAQLHRRVAEAFKVIYAHHPEKFAATIVYHLSKGGDDHDSLAYYAELSGNQAYSLAAYVEAQQYYILVFQAFYENDIYATPHTDVHQDIQQILSRSIDQLPFTNPLHLCYILERLAECSTIQGNFAEGRQIYEYILAIRTSSRFQQYIYTSTPKDDREGRQKKEAQIQALLWREIGNSWTYTTEYEPANRCYQRGKEVMSQSKVTTGAAWACLHLQYGALLRLEGDYYQARRYLQEALTMLEEIVHASPTPSSETDALYAQQKAQSRDHTIRNIENGKDLPLSRIERALIGDPLEIGYAHERLGIVAASLGEVNNALDHLHTALAIYEQSELISEMARVCGNLGAAYIIKGAHDAARTYMHRSLELAERGGDLPNMTFVSFNLGDMAQRSGALQEAETWFTQSLNLAERINDRERISSSNIALASVQDDQGKLQDAAISIHRAISISRSIKSQRCMRYSQIGLADLRICQALALQTRPDAALHQKRQLHLLTRARTMLQRTISLKGMEIEHIVDGKHLLAMIHFLLGDLPTALETTQQTLTDAQGFETPRIIERLYRLLGRIYAAQQEFIQATHYFKDAIEICRKNGLWLDYARTLHCYGALLLCQDVPQQEAEASSNAKYQQGLIYLKEASQIFQTCHAAIDLAATEQLVSQYGTVPSAL
jgi:predicted ATPase/DNA-binding SARP family transcriptional activator